MKGHKRIFGESVEPEAPEGIVNVLINKNSGKLAELNTKNPFLEAFVEGTEPGASEMELEGELVKEVPEKVDDEDFLNL